MQHKIESTENYWAVMSPLGSVQLESIEHTQIRAISEFMNKYNGYTWDYCERKGWQCIKISLTINKR